MKDDQLNSDREAIFAALHQVAVRGPQHVAGMVLFQRFTFDAPSGKIVSITVEPEDRGLFDYVVHTALSEDTVASP